MQTTSPARVANRFNALVSRVEALPLPAGWQRRLLSFGVGLTVPYLSTSGIEIVQLSDAAVTLRVKNRRRVQNHMKGVHASAMFLLAEAATGVLLSANLPEGSKFSTTHIEVDYKKRAQGDLHAVAELSDAQREQVRTQEKGRLVVPVRMSDEAGVEPATFVVEWSWKHPSKAQGKL